MTTRKVQFLTRKEVVENWRLIVTILESFVKFQRWSQDSELGLKTEKLKKGSDIPFCRQKPKQKKLYLINRTLIKTWQLWVFRFGGPKLQLLEQVAVEMKNSEASEKFLKSRKMIDFHIFISQKGSWKVCPSATEKTYWIGRSRDVKRVRKTGGLKLFIRKQRTWSWPVSSRMRDIAHFSRFVRRKNVETIETKTSFFNSLQVKLVGNVSKFERFMRW